MATPTLTSSIASSTVEETSPPTSLNLSLALGVDGECEDIREGVEDDVVRSSDPSSTPKTEVQISNAWAEEFSCGETSTPSTEQVQAWGNDDAAFLSNLLVEEPVHHDGSDASSQKCRVDLLTQRDKALRNQRSEPVFQPTSPIILHIRRLCDIPLGIGYNRWVMFLLAIALLGCGVFSCVGKMCHSGKRNFCVIFACFLALRQ